MSPFKVTFLICSEVLFLKKNKHLVLLFAGTGSVLNSMECVDEKSSQMFNMICSACLEGASRVSSSAYPKAPLNAFQMFSIRCSFPLVWTSLCTTFSWQQIYVDSNIFFAKLFPSYEDQILSGHYSYQPSKLILFEALCINHSIILTN